MLNQFSRILACVCAAVLALSCSVPKEISYFQDTASEDQSLKVRPKQIRLQPDDMICIGVNTRAPELSMMFNLPYAARFIGGTAETTTNGQGVFGYTIDSNGDIDFPVVGKVNVGGYTREEVAERIKYELESRSLVKDPVVTVNFMNLQVSIMGEVTHPGRYNITRDHLTIVDALAMAGDLTIYGQRSNVRVLREKDGVQNTYRVNLCSSADLTSSPVYYIQQNDIIYVEPNDVRARQSTVNGNNVLSTSFWISVASLAATIVTTISVVATRIK